MGSALLRAALVVGLVLFATRPDEADLRDQARLARPAAAGARAPDRADEWRLGPWPTQAGKALLRTLRSPAAALHREDSKLVRDYGLFTTAAPGERGALRVGVLGRWFDAGEAVDAARLAVRGALRSAARGEATRAWLPEHDVLLAGALLFASWAHHATRYVDALVFHAPDVARPWTLVASGLATPSVASLASALLTLVSVGRAVREASGSSSLFWTLFLGCPALATLLTLAATRRRTMFALGNALALVSLSAFGAFKAPNARFVVGGFFRFNFFGVWVLHNALFLMAHPHLPAGVLFVPLLAAALLAVVSMRVWFPAHAVWGEIAAILTRAASRLS